MKKFASIVCCCYAVIVRMICSIIVLLVLFIKIEFYFLLCQSNSIELLKLPKSEANLAIFVANIAKFSMQSDT